MESRRQFYEWLAKTIKMDGIHEVERDTAFDNSKFRSAGIRLRYRQISSAMSDIKEGVLLEVGLTTLLPTWPRGSVPGPMTSPRIRLPLLIIARRPSPSTILPILSLRNCRRFQRNSVNSRKPANFQPICCVRRANARRFSSRGLRHLCGRASGRRWVRQRRIRCRRWRRSGGGCGGLGGAFLLFRRRCPSSFGLLLL